jgi:hypothetical protein
MECLPDKPGVRIGKSHDIRLKYLSFCHWNRCCDCTPKLVDVHGQPPVTDPQTNWTEPFHVGVVEVLHWPEYRLLYQWDLRAIRCYGDWWEFGRKDPPDIHLIPKNAAMEPGAIAVLLQMQADIAKAQALQRARDAEKRKRDQECLLALVLEHSAFIRSQTQSIE